VNFVQFELALMRIEASFTVQAELPQTCSSTAPDPLTHTLAVTLLRAVTGTRW
jgi:hypothetical protein